MFFVVSSKWFRQGFGQHLVVQQNISPYCLIYRGKSQWIHTCSPPTDPLMKGDLCPCTCGEIHPHTGVFIAGQSHQTIKQDCSSSFSVSAVSGDRWFAPGLESVVEQHLPWTLKPYKALYGSPEDVWGIFLCWWCRLLQTTKKKVSLWNVCAI